MVMLRSKTRLVAQANACIQPGLNFFQEKFRAHGWFYTTVRTFQSIAVRFSFKGRLRLNATSVERLKYFPFVNDNIVASLATELPAYLAAADDVECWSAGVRAGVLEYVSWWATRP